MHEPGDASTTISVTPGDVLSPDDPAAAGSADGAENPSDDADAANGGNNPQLGSDTDDTLISSGGNATLAGGDGDDTYVLSGADAYYVTELIVEAAGGGTDTITSRTNAYLQFDDHIENLILTGSDHIGGQGNELDNVITGNAGNNYLAGFDGDDTLIGGGGHDLLIGGNGNDTYVLSAAAPSSLTALIVEDLDGGIDTVVSDTDATLADIDAVENLTLTGSADSEGCGNAENNLITGNGGRNRLAGLDGNDTLISGGGDDTLVGGMGDDTYILNDSGYYYPGELAERIVEEGGGGTDTIISRTHTYLQYGDHIENLTLTDSDNIEGCGNELNNLIIGNAGNNYLSGGEGNDTLIAGGGFDLLIGGVGDDAYVLSKAYPDQIVLIVEDTDGGTDTVVSEADVFLFYGNNVENLTLTGSDNINGWGNELNNAVTGNDGNNCLFGGEGNDTLTGGGSDLLIGGSGDDTYIVSAPDPEQSAAFIVEEDDGGIDTIVTDTDVYLFYGNNIENLTLTGSGDIAGIGNELNNVLTGNAGDNSLSGGEGNDTLTGGGGFDLLIGGVGDDTYMLSKDSPGQPALIIEDIDGGTDTIVSDTNATLADSKYVENLSLTGSANINASGNAANNLLTGNGGSNRLEGLDGNDTLISGAGLHDTLIGGNGDDTYVLSGADPYKVTERIVEQAGGGKDTIVSLTNTYLRYGDGIDNLILTGSGNINGFGNETNNVITGNGANNYLLGGDGNDTLTGGGGRDTLIGGSGNDTYALSDAYPQPAVAIIVEDANGGTDTVVSNTNATLATIKNVENLTLTGHGNINGKGNELNNLITGNSGNNLLESSRGNDKFELAAGGRDVIRLDAATLQGFVTSISGFSSDDTIDIPDWMRPNSTVVSTGLANGAVGYATYFNFDAPVKTTYTPVGQAIVADFDLVLIGYGGPVHLI